MITLEELQTLARERLEDARVLNAAGRSEWAAYTGGYVVELALKRKICETLGWQGYPSSKGEFEQLKSFKTHDLDMLLHLSGVEERIKKGTDGFTDWSIIASWNPGLRYSCEKITKEKAELLLDAVEKLLKKL